jgi:hypothetical protein
MRTLQRLIDGRPIGIDLPALSRDNLAASRRFHVSSTGSKQHDRHRGDPWPKHITENYRERTCGTFVETVRTGLDRGMSKETTRIRPLASVRIVFRSIVTASANGFLTKWCHRNDPDDRFHGNTGCR